MSFVQTHTRANIVFSMWSHLCKTVDIHWTHSAGWWGKHKIWWSAYLAYEYLSYAMYLCIYSASNNKKSPLPLLGLMHSSKKLLLMFLPFSFFILRSLPSPEKKRFPNKIDFLFGGKQFFFSRQRVGGGWIQSKDRAGKIKQIARIHRICWKKSKIARTDVSRRIFIHFSGRYRPYPTHIWCNRTSPPMYIPIIKPPTHVPCLPSMYCSYCLPTDNIQVKQMLLASTAFNVSYQSATTTKKYPSPIFP